MNHAVNPLLRVVCLPLAVLLGVLSSAPNSEAQVVVARPWVGVPVAPLPFYHHYGPVWAGPPASIHIRSPFFSLNVSPGYRYLPSYPTFSYRSYSYAYHNPPIYYGTRSYRQYVPSHASPHVYAPGASGGIPDLTTRPLGESVPTKLSLATLAAAAQAFERGLQRRPNDGDVWRDYLRPDLIAAAASQQQLTPEVAALATKYESVTRNPSLRSIVRITGFSQIQRQLAVWVAQQSSLVAPVPAPPAGAYPNPLDNAEDSAGSQAEAPSGPAPIPPAPSDQLPGDQPPERPMPIPPAPESLPPPPNPKPATAPLLDV